MSGFTLNQWCKFYYYHYYYHTGWLADWLAGRPTGRQAGRLATFKISYLIDPAAPMACLSIHGRRADQRESAMKAKGAILRPRKLCTPLDPPKILWFSSPSIALLLRLIQAGACSRFGQQKVKLPWKGVGVQAFSC